MAVCKSTATRSVALAPAAASSVGLAPTPQTVTVESGDPIVMMVIEQIREKVRTTFGNDVTFALQAS